MICMIFMVRVLSFSSTCSALFQNCYAVKRLNTSFEFTYGNLSASKLIQNKSIYWTNMVHAKNTICFDDTSSKFNGNI